MQTVSKTYGAAAETGAQVPAGPEKPRGGRAKVALIYGNYLGSSKCNFCITSKGQAHRGKIDKCPQEVVDNL